MWLRPTPQSPVAVVVILVVAAQGRQAPYTDGKGEEDLGARVHPHLHREKARELHPRNQGTWAPWGHTDHG